MGLECIIGPALLSSFPLSIAKRPMQATEMFIIGGILALVAVFGVLAYKAEQARKRKLVEKFAQMGWAHFPEPDDPARAAAFASLGGAWSDLDTRATGVKSAASGEAAGRAFTIVDHVYKTGSGKNQQTHTHTIAATPCPAGWPTIELAVNNIFTRSIGELFSSKSLKLEDPEFNKRWRVKTSSEDFAVLALTPELQRWASELPSDAAVRLGGGAITLALRKRISAELVDGLLERCATLAAMLPPELEAWEAAAPVDNAADTPEE